MRKQVGRRRKLGLLAGTGLGPGWKRWRGSVQPEFRRKPRHKTGPGRAWGGLQAPEWVRVARRRLYILLCHRIIPQASAPIRAQRSLSGLQAAHRAS